MVHGIHGSYVGALGNRMRGSEPHSVLFSKKIEIETVQCSVYYSAVGVLPTSMLSPFRNPKVKITQV